MLPKMSMNGMVNDQRDTTWLIMTLGGLAMLAASFVITITDHIFDTLLVTIYLMAIVGTKTVFLPIMRSWKMTTFGGKLSMVTDSFVIILAYKKLIAKDNQITRIELNFLNLAMISALSVGAAFFIGELYGLPYYIHHGLDKVLQSGLPMLLSLWPLLLALAAATKVIADFKPQGTKKFDPRNTVELVFFVGLLILTHDVLLSMGLFLLYESNFWGADGPRYVIRNLNEELQHGGFMALGLIVLALGVRMTPIGNWIAEAEGLQITFAAMVSSPLTGALLVSHSLPEFYEKLGYLIGGAFLAPWSSLVGVMVLKPRQWLSYFMLSIPFCAVYLTLHAFLVSMNAYEWIAHMLGVTGIVGH